ncbi:hypothetical protein [Nonomuraea sp. NPDC049695]
MSQAGGEQVLSYPIPSQAALEPPAEWAEPRRDEGLVVGGLQKVPVRW